MSDNAPETCLAETPREAFTPRTITEAAALRAEVERVRREGLARSLEERHLGIIGLARVVCDANGTAIGAPNVALPSVRFSQAAEERISGALARAVTGIAARLAGTL